MRKYVLAQFAAFSILIGLLGIAAFGLLLWEFQSPGRFLAWRVARGSMELNLVVLLAFGLQHTLMARQGFKRIWRILVPPQLERSTYVMFSGFMLLVIAALWTPTMPPLYDLRGSSWQIPIHGLAILGLLIVAYTALTQRNADLLGFQTLRHILNGTQAPMVVGFNTHGLYRYVRHPLYLGLLIHFWATPAMTHDHLLFAEIMTAYIMVGAAFEEHDLLKVHGAAYKSYQAQVPMFFPWRRWRG